MSEKHISPATTQAVSSYSEEQLKLISDTVAKGASHEELRLFLYRCKNMGLDPLVPGEVHFIKYGSSPGSMVVGLDGFRKKAFLSNQHSGTKRGILRDEKGHCIGAWAEVYRKDWTHPAREEVSLAEYSTGKAMWLKMPETMIKKIAEVAALRMAFPGQLSGLYAPEEMEQSQESAKEHLKKIERTSGIDTARAQLFSLVEKRGIPSAHIVSVMEREFGIKKSAELTTEQVLKLINTILNEPDVAIDADFSPDETFPFEGRTREK